MIKNIFCLTFWSLVLLALLGPGAPVQSDKLPSFQEEAALFSLADLGPVDLSIKRATVEVYVSPYPELNSFHRLFPLIWPRVQDFYARMGIILKMSQGQTQPGPLAPGKNLRLEALTHKEWLGRTFKAFKVAPPFRLRFLAVCQDKYAFAHLHLAIIHLDFKRFQEDICSKQAGQEADNLERLTNLIIHELGHLFGLYHAHEFVNDPISDFLPDSKTPNFMSHYLTYPGGLGFTDYQKRLVHSFLSGGKVYQQYRQVDFDPVRYLELLKLHNKYQEPAAKRSENQGQALALGVDD